jgi:hypothetical protein
LDISIKAGMMAKWLYSFANIRDYAIGGKVGVFWQA